MQGIKRRAVLSKTMERTAEKKAIFGVGIKKKKSRTCMVTGFLDGGSGGIRTHEPVKAT